MEEANETDGTATEREGCQEKPASVKGEYQLDAVVAIIITRPTNIFNKKMRGERSCLYNI